MKNLIIFVICLLSICARAANPPVTAFDTNTMYVTGNGTGPASIGAWPTMRNIRSFGAIGIPADDTAAFQAAANYPGGVWVDPNLTYSIGQIVLTNNSRFMGQYSYIKFATNATGPMFWGTNNITNVFLSGLLLDGQSYGFQGVGFSSGYSTAWDFTAAFVGIKQNIAAVATRSGIYMDSHLTNVVISDCLVRNFSDAGYRFSSPATFPQPTSKQLTFRDCAVENCWQGVSFTQNAEYVNPQNFNASACGQGVDIGAGNILFNGLQVTKGGVGIHAYGGVNNPAHSTIGPATINHCYQSVYCQDFSNGEKFLGLNVEGDGAQVLSNCTGVIFMDCTLMSNGTFDQTFGADFLVDGTGALSGTNYVVNCHNVNFNGLPWQVKLVNSGKINLGTGPVAIGFPPTTTKWTNGTPSTIELYINNTGVTGTVIAKNGTTIETVLTGPFQFTLQPGEYFSETYTVGSPSATYSPK